MWGMGGGFSPAYQIERPKLLIYKQIIYGMRIAPEDLSRIVLVNTYSEASNHDRHTSLPVLVSVVAVGGIDAWH
jgi:hypothetical protein